jgi:membrane protease YdiL (CAAX protease family)
MEIFMTMARSGSFEVALINTALISLVPGFVEETLFRGYVQRRLLER